MVTTKQRPEYFEKIVELRPRDSDSHFYRGYSLGAQGDYEGALASFDAALGDQAA